jgi:hypothetical protein
LVIAKLTIGEFKGRSMDCGELHHWQRADKGVLIKKVFLRHARARYMYQMAKGRTSTLIGAVPIDGILFMNSQLI